MTTITITGTSARGPLVQPPRQTRATRLPAALAIQADIAQHLGRMIAARKAAPNVAR